LKLSLTIKSITNEEGINLTPYINLTSITNESFKIAGVDSGYTVEYDSTNNLVTFTFGKVLNVKNITFANLQNVLDINGDVISGLALNNIDGNDIYYLLITNIFTYKFTNTYNDTYINDVFNIELILSETNGSSIDNLTHSIEGITCKSSAGLMLRECSLTDENTDKFPGNMKWTIEYEYGGIYVKNENDENTMFYRKYCNNVIS
jgi:hypothetical protein